MMNTSKTIKYLLIILLGIITFFLISKLLQRTATSELDDITVTLTAKVLKDDVFQFFYWEKTDEKFKIENAVRTKVKGSSQFQDIVFKLPKLTNLYRLRLDIGENLEQQKIKIKEIQFNSSTSDNKFDLHEFNTWFKPNKYILIDGKGEYSGILGGGKKSFYDPYFVSVDSSHEMNVIKGNEAATFSYLASIITSLIVMLFLYNIQAKITVSAKGIFGFTFMLILVLPFIQKEIPFVNEFESLEKRKMAQKPDFAFSKKFARGFETYFNDNFGFRNRLVNWGGTYRTKLFRSSMHPEVVMFGKKDWLFYNRMGGRMYRSYSRNSLLSETQQDSIINRWQMNKEKYESQGRKYFLSFWPNKHTIYSENLSYTMNIQIKDTVSRVDQLIERTMKVNAAVKLTDVRPKLVESKKEAVPLYYRFDSHWNDYGAFLAYQDFFIQNPDIGFEPKSKNDFNIKWKDHFGGEHIAMLGVHNIGYFKEKKPVFTLKENKNQIEYLPIEGYPKLTVITRNKFAGNKLKALVFRDSYTNSLIQFFSLHFYEVVYIWGHKEEFVEKENPDVIIEGYVEREIGNVAK